MSVESNVALMRRWFDEVWNQGRAATVHELSDERAVGMGLAELGTETQGPAGFLEFLERIRGAFPDIRVKVEDAFGAGDRVAVRWSATMTHRGDHLGVPASHNPVTITGTTSVRVESGKIVHAWNNWDQLAMMEQIEARPQATAKLSDTIANAR